MNEVDFTYATEEIRKAVAHTLESPSSPLCDCSREENPPINPRTGKRLYHHCDCRAVEAAAIVLGTHGRTLHSRLCVCGDPS